MNNHPTIPSSNHPTRTALFGGTFDPPHEGHLAVARAAADAFHLSQVLWAPVGHQPLKSTQPTASFEDRIEMVRLACAADSRFVVSNIDAPRTDGKSNYTIDTLTQLRKTHPDTAWWNIVGADSFLDLRRWKDPDRLLEIAEWVVVSRPGFDIERIDTMGLTASQRDHVHVLTNVAVPVSATHLREELHKSHRSMNIPTNVMDYIEHNGLYR